MKNQIQQEATKAAEAIREALEAFNQATGLSAGVSADWYTTQTLGEQISTARLARVVLNIDGFKAST